MKLFTSFIKNRNTRVCTKVSTTCVLLYCDNKPCIATPGIPGTDLSQPYLDGSNDGYWRVVADRGQSRTVALTAVLATKCSNDNELALELPCQCGVIVLVVVVLVVLIIVVIVVVRVAEIDAE